jgi:hypothetical protein
MVVTLLSTCAISGTFAKYVTKAEGQDTARVAKWGVLLNVSGNAFAEKYEATDAAYLDAGGKYSVEAFNGTDKVVAPGTNSTQAKDNLVGTVKGTPEVAARYAITLKKGDDIVLPAGTYTDYTELVKDENTGKYGYTKTFTLDKAYAPVKWNLVISKGETTLDVAKALYAKLPANLIAVAENYGLTESGCSIFDAITILKKVAGNEGYVNIVDSALSQIVSGGRNFQIEVADDGTITMSYDFDPNKEMDYTFTLSWEWAFQQENVELFDKADTLLGNIAAGVLEAPAGASTVLAANVAVSATQID